tara:strand:+ start:35 stop:1408 length:1374 start_codon:yes stop_codon:yes gene_type:complete
MISSGKEASTMKVTKKMLRNGYSGPGEMDDSVAEYVDGKRYGLGVDKTYAGQYKDDKLHGYAISKVTRNINRYEDGQIVEQLVTRNMNGNVWIGTGNTGILIRDDGTIGYKKPVYVENPVYVLTDKKEYKRISMVDLKMRQMDMRGWHCPIYKTNFSINPVGEICSGVCANVRHIASHEGHWKDYDKLDLNTETLCKTKACFCDADLLQPKAKTEELLEYFVRNKQFNHWELEELPVVETDDNIVAMGRGMAMPMAEVHFHIGLRCNYDCAYCPGPTFDDEGKLINGVHDNASPHMTTEEFTHGLNLVDPYVPKKPSRRLYITGGEPTLNPQIVNLVDISFQKGYETRISTNGTGSEKKYRDLLDKGVFLEFSFHVEFTIDKVIQKVANLVADYPQDQINVKCMSFEDTPFAEKVQKIIPKDKDIFYYPIYGRDIEHKYYFERTEEQKAKAEVIFSD